MSEDVGMTTETSCPTCGRDGVRACIGELGGDLSYDHEGRPPFFPPGFDRIFPPKAER